MNHVACCVERSGNRHFFALVLLRVVLIIEEVSGCLAILRLACDQGILSAWEFYYLALECLVLLLVLLLLLPWLLSTAAALGSQTGDESTEGRCQNQCERRSMMIASLQYLPPLFSIYFILDKAIALSAKFKNVEDASPFRGRDSVPGCSRILIASKCV